MIVDRPRQGWDYLPPKAIDKRIYGKFISAVYLHLTGALLLHHKLTPYQDEVYEVNGQWLLCVNDRMIDRRSYYGEKCEMPPYEWANRRLEKFLKTGV